MNVFLLRRKLVQQPITIPVDLRSPRGSASFIVGLALLVMSPQFLRAQEDANVDKVDTRALTPPPHGPTKVSVNLFNIEIFSIDEREETFEIEAYLQAEWLDKRFAFEENDLDTDRLVYQGEAATERLKGMWWPYFEITDARGSRDRMYNWLRIKPDGTVLYLERFHVFIKQDFDLSGFPFDQHTISFSVEPTAYATKDVIFQEFPKDSDEEENEEAGWEPEDWNVDWSELTITNESKQYANATVEMDIRRKSRHFVTNVIVPLTLIIFISSAVFWMSVDLGGRLGVSFTSLLTVVAFDFVTSDSLPKLGYSTVLDNILTLSYVFVAANIFENVVASKLHDARPHMTFRLDKAFRWVYPTAYVVIVLALITIGYFAQ